jgi:hypothetical protein
LSGTDNRLPPQTLNPSLTISFRIVSWTPSTVVDLGEALGGLLVVGILVGVVLEGELAVRPLDLVIRRAFGHLQHVVVALPAPPPTNSQSNRPANSMRQSGFEHADLNPDTTGTRSSSGENREQRIRASDSCVAVTGGESKGLRSRGIRIR